MIAGLDPIPIRQGAAEVLDRALQSSPRDCPPAFGAALNVALLWQKRIGTCVLMPYVDALASFGLWFRQLWAESLGKNGTGTTPIRAMGTVDQHSQLQLYLAGPADKFYTLILMPRAGTKGFARKIATPSPIRTKPTAHWSLLRVSMCARTSSPAPV